MCPDTIHEKSQNSIEQPKDIDKKDGTVDFMIAEYQHHLDEFRRNEELGESRVNLFLTIVTVVFTGGAFAFINVMSDTKSDLSKITIYSVILIAFAITALFGYLTLLRLVHRNLASSEELRASHRIKRFFADRDPGIDEYLYYKPFDNEPKRKVKWSKDARFGRGGLVETVMLINAILVAVLVILAIVVVILAIPSSYFGLVPGLTNWLIVPLCIIIYLYAGYAMWRWQSDLVNKKYENEKINSKFQKPSTRS